MCHRLISLFLYQITHPFFFVMNLRYEDQVLEDLVCKLTDEDGNEVDNQYRMYKLVQSYFENQF